MLGEVLRGVADLEEAGTAVEDWTCQLPGELRSLGAGPELVPSRQFYVPMGGGLAMVRVGRGRGGE